MASQQSTVDYILEQIESAGRVSARKMFGEYGLYCDAKIIALVCEDQLFVKVTSAGKAVVGDCPEKPPYPGAKPWLWISGDRWDDNEWMSHLIKVTAKELPMAKPPPKEKTKAKAKSKARGR